MKGFIDRIKRSENELSESKGFFNRGKIDEELEALVQERKKVEAKQKEWSRYSQNEQDVLLEKERLMQQYHALRLKRQSSKRISSNRSLFWFVARDERTIASFLNELSRRGVDRR